MNLEDFFRPGTRYWQGEHSDKRVQNSFTSGTREIVYEKDFLKVITTFRFENDLDTIYPTKHEKIIPKSVIKTGNAKWKIEDVEYGAINVDIVLVKNLLISHFQSENGEHRGSSVTEQIDIIRYKETGFAYSAQDDLLRWEIILNDNK